MDPIFDVFRSRNFEVSFSKEGEDLSFLQMTCFEYNFSLAKKEIRAKFLLNLAVLEWVKKVPIGETLNHTYKIFSKDASIVKTIISETVTLKDIQFLSRVMVENPSDKDPKCVELVFSVAGFDWFN